MRSKNHFVRSEGIFVELWSHCREVQELVGVLRKGVVFAKLWSRSKHAHPRLDDGGSAAESYQPSTVPTASATSWITRYGLACRLID